MQLLASWQLSQDLIILKQIKRIKLNILIKSKYRFHKKYNFLTTYAQPNTNAFYLNLLCICVNFIANLIQVYIMYSDKSLSLCSTYKLLVHSLILRNRTYNYFVKRLMMQFIDYLLITQNILWCNKMISWNCILGNTLSN